MTTFTIDRRDSPWTGMTGSAEEEAATMRIRALPFDAAAYSGFEHLKKYDTAAGPLIFRAREKKEVGVNSRHFSDLARADATRAGRDTGIPIGRFLDPTFASLSPGTLAAFLIESQIIITYWHIGSDLNLESEKHDRSEYIAYFMGKHTYFTNERNVDPLRFAVEIDLTTGDMFLRGY
ncbi:MAG: hypothetical protein KBA61_00995 [Spirochaetes bacterium]|nr:hypothetical protein [Spirochaetota bacterium]